MFSYTQRYVHLPVRIIIYRSIFIVELLQDEVNLLHDFFCTRSSLPCLAWNTLYFYVRRESARLLFELPLCVHAHCLQLFFAFLWIDRQRSAHTQPTGTVSPSPRCALACTKSTYPTAFHTLTPSPSRKPVQLLCCRYCFNQQSEPGCRSLGHILGQSLFTHH